MEDPGHKPLEERAERARIEEAGAAAPSEMPPMPPASAFKAAEGDANEAEDDLPF